MLKRQAAEDGASDALVDRQLREAGERANEPMVTPESIREGQAVMARMHDEATAALSKRIARKNRFLLQS
jgi:hypothetical protein